MKKRLIALLMTSLMVISLCAGCGSNESGSTAETETTASVDDESQNSSEEWTWPLAEKKELSIWIVWSSDFVDSIDDLKAIQQIEKNTNVHVNWTAVHTDEAEEKFSLMIASGDYPDIIMNADKYYSGGVSAMCDDGVSVDLTDYIEKYMPNYWSLINSNDRVIKDVMTDDQRMVSVYTLASQNGELAGEKPYGGIVCRRDWLEEMGLDTPVTIDDWHEALLTVKEKYPDAIPLMLPSDGIDNYGTFVSAYGVLGEFYQDNGVVKYGPCEDGYKQWLQTMNQWYSEGLIDPNFISAEPTADYFSPMDYIGSGKAFAGNSMWGYTADNMKTRGYNDDENFYLTAVSYPVLKEGDTPEAGADMSTYATKANVITTAAEDLELTMRYLDYWYSQDCMLLDSLGIEGESYTDNGDGTYSLTPELLKMVEDGVVPTKTEAVYTYTLGNNGFGLYNWGRFDAIYAGEENYKAYDIWASAQYDLIIPTTVSMTAEETSEYASLYADILTLVQENTVKFITGAQSLDDYDAFVEQLKACGIDKCIGYKQAALDRYNARVSEN